MIGKTKQQSVSLAAAVPSRRPRALPSSPSRLVARVGRRARLAVAICVACFGVLLLPAAASAALLTIPGPSFPTPVEVGETFVGSVSVFNASTPPESVQFPTVRMRDLALVPSCAPIFGGVGNDCPTPFIREVGVFQLASTGVGVAEQGAPQGCAGTWTITQTSPGVWLFTPPGGNGSLIQAPGALCRVDFQVTTFRVPTNDVNPAAPGVQTQQVATVTGVPRDPEGVDQQALAVRNAGQDITTVRQGQPEIVTQVQPAAIELGQSFTDQATLSFPAGAATPTGTVTFRVYGPNDATCAGPPIFTSPDRPLTGPAAGPLTATSTAYTPPAAGTYRVIATYNSGADPNYEDVSGACNEPNETVVVAQVQPELETQVSDDAINLGQSFTDVATLSFPAGAATPTGTVTFRVYGPNDATCAGPPIFTSSNRPLTGPAAGPLTATSTAFTPPAAGTYRVIASYEDGPDPNYEDVSGACNDANETVVVAQVQPEIETQVSDATISVGQTFTDEATLSFPAGAATPTGTVTFRVYGPNDATCAGPPIFTSSNRPLTGPAGGPLTATSTDFTPPAAGTYRVIAEYEDGPDPNYEDVSGACNDANETVVVARVQPDIETLVSDATITLGETFTDTATVTGPAGAPGPSGTVDFFVYGPDDPNCSDAPVGSSPDRALAADGTATSGTFTPVAAGTYRLIAAYSGDANYDPVVGGCNDPGETVVVEQFTAEIVTAVSDETITVGETFTDTATITGVAGGPAPTGTVDFVVYGPGDGTCTGTPVATSLNRPVGAGGTATSGTFTPEAPGTYRVIARYSGDANYAPVSGECNDANETVVVTQPAPPPPPPPPAPAPCVQNGSVVQSNTGSIQQGANTATGGSASATGGPGGDASSANTVNNTGNASSSGTINMGADTHTSSGDATGGDGGDASATGGNATAGNTATQTQQNVCGGSTGAATDDGPSGAATDDGPSGAAAAGGSSGPAAAVSGKAAAGGPSGAATGGAVSGNDAVGSGGSSGAARGGDAAGAGGTGRDVAAPGRAAATDAAKAVMPSFPIPAPASAPKATPSGSAGQVDSVRARRVATATISGRRGCQNGPFNVVVSGRQIGRVAFALDGKKVRTLTRPNSATRYKLLVKPVRLSTGRHRVSAVVTFRRQSATPSRTLRVVFSRCARRRESSAPRLTQAGSSSLSLHEDRSGASR